MSGDAATEEHSQGPLFRDINADDYDPEITEIESICMNCHEQGMTRLFLTRIPFFREVIVSSFVCDHCGYRNAELQPAGRIQDEGVKFTLTVKTAADLNRQIVQNQSATISIPSLEFEVPPKKGVLTTVEGILTTACEDLEQNQVLRRIQHPEVAAQIDDFIGKLKSLLELKTSFDLAIDDPSGNSFVENPFAPNKDPQMVIDQYTRTKEQDNSLGLYEQEPEEGGGDAEEEEGVGINDGKGFDTTGEVMTFKTNCPNCNAPCDTNMKVVNIPYFKEVVIMATVCEACGHKDNEVKGGGGIEPKGRRITLKVKNREDMSRDILKSDTCSIAIPELDFETEMGTLGGKFTTVEGLLLNCKDQLLDSNPFLVGDSSKHTKGRLQAFCGKLEQIISCEMTDISLVLDDPAGNSYIQSLCAPDPDPQLTIDDYERNYDQNEDLGLNDMKTENYEES